MMGIVPYTAPGIVVNPTGGLYNDCTRKKKAEMDTTATTAMPAISAVFQFKPKNGSMFIVLLRLASLLDVFPALAVFADVVALINPFLGCFVLCCGNTGKMSHLSQWASWIWISLDMSTIIIPAKADVKKIRSFWLNSKSVTLPH